jgi:hypothetical protein
MKKIIISLLFATVALSACEKYESIERVDTDYKSNFEQFWSLIDEQYCYLDYKGIDWDKVKEEFMPRVEAAKDEFEFFKILTEALALLKDGHVGIISQFQAYGCDTYLYDDNGVRYPKNFDKSLLAQYMKGNELYNPIDSAVLYGTIEDGDRTYAYIYYSSFSNNWSANTYYYVEQALSDADGIIFDIRNNGGGNGVYGLNLASHFFKEKELVGYHAFKNGPGHSDFGEKSPLYVEPTAAHDWSDKPAILLTNRNVYSTANLFTSALQYAPNVTHIGGKSGGGGGMPMTHYLSNGWLLIFPSNTLYDRDGNHIEYGIDPDILIDADAEMANGRDIIIERAIEELRNK